MSAAYELKRGNQDLQKAFNNIRPWFNLEGTKMLLNKYPVVKKLLDVADEIRVKKVSDGMIG